MENQNKNFSWRSDSQEQDNQQPQATEEQLNEDVKDISSWDWQEQELDPLNINTESDFSELDNNNWERKTSIIGLLPKLSIEALVYKFNYNDIQAVSQLDLSNLEKVNEDGKYKVPLQNDNDELINILTGIKNIGESRGMKLLHSYLYKNSPNESSINISRGECIYNYIYFLQADHSSGTVILDFSALNGPTEQVIESSPGLLLLLPGWVPYSITKNLSNKDMIAVAGRFVAN